MPPSLISKMGASYCAIGDYYFISGEDEPEGKSIGIWGQRHLRYIRSHRRVLFTELLTSGRLHDYLAELNEDAEEMFSLLVDQLAEKEGVTETLKAENQILWIQRMNNIRHRAAEAVYSDLIYT